jgi:DNA replication and repair protein RecF
MFLSYLELKNFRNIESQGINLPRGITVLWGDNGGGKTNIIESIYFLSYLRPLRRGGVSQLLKHGEGDSHVSGKIRSGKDEADLRVFLKRGGKVTPLREKVRAGSFREYVGGLYSVAFVPEDIREIFGSPQGRRRLIDQSAAMAKPLHVDVLIEFMKCLRQRNRLLFLIREGRTGESLLDSFDKEMIRLSVELSARRREMLHRIEGYFQSCYEEIDGTGGVALKGRMDFDEREFKSCRARDIEKGVSTYGPHRDDFSILVDGKEGRFFTSQGRKRIISVAFRLSQALLLRDLTGQKPVLLLDDITSEVDPGRRKRLLGTIEKLGFQTIITTTDATLINEGFSQEIRALKVQNGSIL